ncbi:MAG: [FeFe] hydrogenase H-cluster radical SAM maturase HydE [Firmicutes bacterium HGW-Firmicutes-15]|nr:MAG: [FeFe] hydrogenase H-cluster radical SAM maturase HydE [Firmicutes bacterium HGW-Firmicutes-15]
MKALIDKLEKKRNLTNEEFVALISNRNPELDKYLFEKAVVIRNRHYESDIYIRGLIEFTNFCKKDCLYCGIRKSNQNAERYRLTKEQVLDCCKTGYDLGFRTFVLQGGEDAYFNDDRICDMIKTIKSQHSDCALTLSIGEKSYASYEAYHNAGADRYLLRHETANDEHYKKLHPLSMSLSNRKQCLYNLKKIGFQVGCGFMVGSPYQNAEYLAEDMLFIHYLQPQMVGVGPFIPHRDTPFASEPAGTLEMTLFMLGLIRLMLPNVLMPSTTALGTIHPKGRELGILAGANVVMPNLSPTDVRNKYLLYDNKICTGDEAAECQYCMQHRMEEIGYSIKVDRGDYKPVV